MKEINFIFLISLKLISILCLGIHIPSSIVFSFSTLVFLLSVQSYDELDCLRFQSFMEFISYQIITDVVIRIGIVISTIFHEWGHIIAGCVLGYGKEIFTSENFSGHVSITDWIKNLRPYTPMNSLIPHVKLPSRNAEFLQENPAHSNSLMCHEENNLEAKIDLNHLKIIKFFGWFSSLLLSIFLTMLYSYSRVPSNSQSMSEISQSFVIGSLICLFGATSSDIFDSVEKSAEISGIPFFCGNFGLMLAGSFEKIKKHRIDAVSILESMAAVSTQRGGQSGGLVSFYERCSGSLEAIRVRILPSKRESLSQKLAARFSYMWTLTWFWDWLISRAQKFWWWENLKIKPTSNSTNLTAVKDSSTPKLEFSHKLFAGHTRFATSSIPSVKETHPHQWTPCRNQTVWSLDNRGRLVSSQKSVGVYVTHNGDFEFWNLFNRDRTHSEIGAWLEVVLSSKQPAKCDSVMIGGLIELLRTQGLWVQSLRLAYHQVAVSSFEEIFLQGKPKSKSSSENRHNLSSLISPSKEVWDVLAKLADEATSLISSYSRNLQSYGSKESLEFGSISDTSQVLETTSEFSINRSFNKVLSDEGKENLLQKILSALKRDGAKELRKKLIEKNFNLIDSLSNQLLEDFITQSIHNFFHNDLFWAVKKFLANAKGSFGLCVLCTLDNDRAILSAFNQPLSVGFSPFHRIVLYSSESQALQVNLKNKSKPFVSLPDQFKKDKNPPPETDDVPDSHIEYRLDLNESDGEVIELTLLPKDVDLTTSSVSSLHSLASHHPEPPSTKIENGEQNHPSLHISTIRTNSVSQSTGAEALASSSSPSTPLRSPSFSKNFSLFTPSELASSMPETTPASIKLEKTNRPHYNSSSYFSPKSFITSSEIVIDVNKLNDFKLNDVDISSNNITNSNSRNDNNNNNNNNSNNSNNHFHNGAHNDSNRDDININISPRKSLLTPDKLTALSTSPSSLLCCVSSQTLSSMSLSSSEAVTEDYAITSSSVSSMSSPTLKSTVSILNSMNLPNSFMQDKIIKSEKVIPLGAGMMSLNQKDAESANNKTSHHSFVLSEIPFVRISIHNRRQNTFVSKVELASENRMIHMKNNKYITFHDTAVRGDVIGKDIKEIPKVLQTIRSDWLDENSLNRQTAEKFFELIFEKAKKFSRESNSSGSTRKEVDVLITGIENSLWVGEQFAADLQNCFPQLRVVPVSANKVIGVLGNARGAISTSGFSFCRITNALTNTIVLAISQSGQTFPTLHATKILSKECPGRVFSCVGMVDSKMSSAVGQQLSATSPFCQRIFHTHAGWRSAEPSTVAVCSAHATLTELMLFIAQKFRDISIHNFTPSEIFSTPETISMKMESNKVWMDKLKSKPLGLRLNYADMMDLVRIRDSFVDVSVPALIDEKGTSAIRSNLIHQGYQWGLHIIETPIAWAFSAIYIFATVIFGVPIFATAFKALNLGYISLYFAHALDALVYCFLPLIFSFLLRLIQRRDLFARLGKRTLVIGDVPYVHQILESFVSKLFSLSYSIASIDVHGANPIDHFVHRFTHRVNRGVLLAIGRPDGRLCSQTKCESWVLMALLQARTISNLTSGPEALTIGHNPHSDDAVIKNHIILPSHRPSFLCEKLLGVDDFEPLKLLASRQFALASSRGRNSFKELDSRVVGSHLCYESTVQRARRLGVSMMAHGTDQINEEETENPMYRNAVLNALDLDVQRLLELQSPLEELVENRFLSFERLLAFQIVFHKMAQTVSGLWPLNFDMWRSQSCLRIATTAAPVSAADLEREWLETINEPIHDITVHPRLPRISSHYGQFA